MSQVWPLIARWYAAQPIVSGLLVLIAVDVISGSASAMISKQLNSAASWRGISRKALTLLVLLMAGALEPAIHAIPQFGGIPLANLFATFYSWTEALSITENLSRCGVPLPPGLVAVLSKLRGEHRLSIPIELTAKSVSLVQTSGHDPEDKAA